MNRNFTEKQIQMAKEKKIKESSFTIIYNWGNMNKNNKIFFSTSDWQKLKSFDNR